MLKENDLFANKELPRQKKQERSSSKILILYGLQCIFVQAGRTMVNRITITRIVSQETTTSENANLPCYH